VEGNRDLRHLAGKAYPDWGFSVPPPRAILTTARCLRLNPDDE
jgi:hypothetical protein